MPHGPKVDSKALHADGYHILDLKRNWGVDKRWTPKMDAGRRETIAAAWSRAVQRSFDWKTDED